MHRLIAGGVLAALLVPMAALADIRVDLNANEGGEAWSDGLVFEPPVTKAWGSASVGLGQSSGTIQTGVPPGCLSTLCDPGLAMPGASASLRADTTTMRLGVRAFAWEAQGLKPEASARVIVDDTLLVTAPTTLNFSIRLELGLSASTADDTLARYTFALTQGSGDHVSTVFSFSASDEGLGSTSLRQAVVGGSAFGLLEGELMPLPSVPEVFEFSFSLLADVGGLPIQLYTYAGAGAEEGGVASVEAINTSALGISGAFVSQSGYGYAAPVPEPATVATLLAGLLLVSSKVRLARRLR